MFLRRFSPSPIHSHPVFMLFAKSYRYHSVIFTLIYKSDRIFYTQKWCKRKKTSHFSRKML